MKKVCMSCNSDMGEVDGQGYEGTTSGLCPECANIEKLKFAQHLVLTRGISWDEAKKIVERGARKAIRVATPE